MDNWVPTESQREVMEAREALLGYIGGQGSGRTTLGVHWAQQESLHKLLRDNKEVPPRRSAGVGLIVGNREAIIEAILRECPQSYISGNGFSGLFQFPDGHFGFRVCSIVDPDVVQQIRGLNPEWIWVDDAEMTTDATILGSLMDRIVLAYGYSRMLVTASDVANSQRSFETLGWLFLQKHRGIPTRVVNARVPTYDYPVYATASWVGLDSGLNDPEEQ